eukprot:Tbor_TRINITY_DN5744_c0_g2::TRINITY_DN5744_c0_g2_i3::g.20415::m.20415
MSAQGKPDLYVECCSTFIIHGNSNFPKKTQAVNIRHICNFQNKSSKDKTSNINGDTIPKVNNAVVVKADNNTNIFVTGCMELQKSTKVRDIFVQFGLYFWAISW